MFYCYNNFVNSGCYIPSRPPSSNEHFKWKKWVSGVQQIWNSWQLDEAVYIDLPVMTLKDWHVRDVVTTIMAWNFCRRVAKILTELGYFWIRMLSTSLASYYTPLIYYTPLSYIHDMQYLHSMPIKIRPGTYCMGDSTHALQNMASPFLHGSRSWR